MKLILEGFKSDILYFQSKTGSKISALILGLNSCCINPLFVWIIEKSHTTIKVLKIIEDVNPRIEKRVCEICNIIKVSEETEAIYFLKTQKFFSEAQRLFNINFPKISFINQGLYEN